MQDLSLDAQQIAAVGLITPNPDTFSDRDEKNLAVEYVHTAKIFFFQGSLMAILGGIVGLIIGYIIIFLQQQFSLIMLTPSLPYPVTLRFDNAIIVFVTISVLGVIAAKIASVRITKPLVSV